MTRWKPSDLEKIKHKIKSEPFAYVIGIDCGVSTGFAVWSKREKKLICVETLKIHQAMERIKHWMRAGEILVRVEDARLRKWIPRMENEKAERGRREGAGSVKRDAKIFEDFLTDLGCQFEMVAPKNNKTKMDSEQFAKLTGFEGRTSEHSRDAGGLVIGF